MLVPRSAFVSYINLIVLQPYRLNIPLNKQSVKAYFQNDTELSNLFPIQCSLIAKSHTLKLRKSDSFETLHPCINYTILVRAHKCVCINYARARERDTCRLYVSLRQRVLLIEGPLQYIQLPPWKLYRDMGEEWRDEGWRVGGCINWI